MFPSNHSNIIMNRTSFLRSVKLISVLLLVILIFSLGYYTKKYRLYETLKAIGKEIIEKNISIPGDFVQGVLSKPEKIYLQIEPENYRILKTDRNIAVRRGLLLNDHREEVPARLIHNDKSYKTKIRLKGDWADHFKDRKVSLRINVKGKEKFLGLDEFSIQHPRARSYLNEWIGHRLGEKEGLIFLKTLFVEVSVNGKRKGIYFLEEYFDDALMENMKLKKGIIFKPLETEYELKVFNKKDIYASDIREHQLALLYEKHDSFVEGKLPANKIFDITKMAKWYAISDLVRGYHQFYYNNIHLYYNPETQLIEPIGREWNDYFNEGKEISIEMVKNTEIKDNPLNNWFHKRIFSDEKFVTEYYKVLERISEHEYLDNFFNENSTDLENNLNIIYKDYILYKYDKSLLYRNQKLIQDKISPERVVKAYYRNIEKNYQEIMIKNLSAFPIAINNLKLNESDLYIKEIRLKPMVKSNNEEFYIFQVHIHDTTETAVGQNLNIGITIIGAEDERIERVLPWPDQQLFK